jgi:hypothetical protein
MGRGKGNLNVGPRPLMASCYNARGSVIGLCTCTTARASRDAAEGFLPVIVPMRAAPAQAIAADGVADVATVDVTTTQAGAGGDM